MYLFDDLGDEKMDFDMLIVDTIVRDDDHQAGDEFKTLLTLQQNFDLVVRDRHKKFQKTFWRAILT